ncbi:MAG: hypothetical protein WCT49_00580 [Candidatus Paceibacterota bacterium]
MAGNKKDHIVNAVLFACTIGLCIILYFAPQEDEFLQFIAKSGFGIAVSLLLINVITDRL